MLGAAAGIIREFSVPISKPELLKNGGFVYLTLASDSDGSGLIFIVGGLKIYASRFPSLSISKGRPLFSPVLFPVVDPTPALDYAEIFAEVENYDDGWAKAVHCVQQKQLSHLDETPDGTRPVKELGIRIGWDDEQVAVWMNRQLDSSLPEYDAPIGVSGYRVDVRLLGTTKWSSLVLAAGELTIGTIHFPPDPVELFVGTHPVQHNVQDSGPSRTFWLPMYFTSWSGPALVAGDELKNRLTGIPPSPPGTMMGIQPGTILTYGKSYEFQVRLMDSTGGGPGPQSPHITSGPQIITAIEFKRYIIPRPPIIVTAVPLDPDPTNPPTSLTLKRPLINYPAVACTEHYSTVPNLADLLLADLDVAKVEGREAGLPDPDMDLLSITVEADDFPQDPAATDGTFMPVYSTTRPFPVDSSQTAQVDFTWQDIIDVETIRAAEESKTTGPLTLPTARTLRIRFAPLCSDKANYFGGDDIRTSGPSVYVTVRKHSQNETNLFVDDLPSKVFSAYFLQPDKPSDETVTVDAAPPDIASRLAASLNLQLRDLTMRSQPGRRVIFGCAAGLRHTIGPDGASLTFASRTDLGLRWLAVFQLTIHRDWTWDGFDYRALHVKRDGKEIGQVTFPRSIGKDAFLDNNPEAMKLARSQTDIVFIDSINPLPPPGEFPQILNPSYTVTPVFKSVPAPSADPPRNFTIRLPVTTPPTQIPKLASAGLAFSPYTRAADYSSTNPRTKMLWLEFASPPADPRDIYFARVIRNVPDPQISQFIQVKSLPRIPGLAIDAESVRHIVRDQAADPAGLSVMTPLIPSDQSPVHFGLPLPVDADSPMLFGFWEYEFRIGHSKALWSTAQGRYGPGLVVNSVQHSPPALQCRATRTRATGIIVSAPHAVSVYNGTLFAGLQPRTRMWFLLYAQATQIDGDDVRNILLLRAQGFVTRTPPIDRSGQKYQDAWAVAGFDEKTLGYALAALGFRKETRLSVIAVELMPVELISVEEVVGDPVGGDLGKQRILRTSVLVPVPAVC